MTKEFVRKLSQGSEKSLFLDSRVCRRIVTLLTLLTLLASVLVPGVLACGPSFKDAVFTHQLHPDLPLKLFARGELGILRPEFARSYLAVAYRHIKGVETDKEVAEQFAKLWDRRLSGCFDKELLDAMNVWLEARKSISDKSIENIEVYKFDGYSYSSYLNIAPDAFYNAKKTLGELVKKYGASDTRVKDWIDAQDMVFARGGEFYNKKMPPPPEPLPDDAEQQLKNDRQYQIGCAYFYGGELDKALEQFRSISADPDSSWSKLCHYLVARTLCRKATLSSKPGNELNEAKRVLDEILANPKESAYHGAAKDLASFVRFRLEPEKRALELSELLRSNEKGANYTEALGDYTWLLDRLPDTGAKDSSDAESGAVPTETGVGTGSGNSTKGGAEDSSAGYLMFAVFLIALAAFLKTDHASRRLPWSGNLYVLTLLSLASVVVLMACTSKTSANKPVKQQAEKVLSDDLSQWIFNFQSQKPEALEFAYSRWKEKGDELWLLSTISKLKPEDKRLDEILGAAEKVNSASPGFATIAFHRVRLMNAGDSKEAYELASSMLKQKERTLPPSSRNLVINELLSLTPDFDEFSSLIEAKPAEISWDYDIAGLPEGPLHKFESQSTYSVYKPRLTYKAATVLNTVLPLSYYGKLLERKSLTDEVKFDIAQAAWVRAVLLKDQAMAGKMAQRLSSLNKQLKPSLDSYIQTSDPAQRDFLAMRVILQNPLLRPYVSGGLPRESAMGEIDNYRDNWWCAEPSTYYQYNEQDKKGKSISVACLSEEERAKGIAEYNALKALGPAPNILVSRVLAFSGKKPGDPRLAETLHLAVRATRYGCTDDHTTEFSKKAFKELHKSFPGNKWTKKTPYWF